jgi:hypothetical protein
VEKNDDLMQNIWAPSHRRMGRLRGQLQPGRYGHGTSARCPPESTVRGLICLGCAHAQRKKCACRSLGGASWPPTSAAWALREVTKEAGQIALREMEIVRIRGAMQRAEELSDDVAAAIERALRSRITTRSTNAAIFRAELTQSCHRADFSVGRCRPATCVLTIVVTTSIVEVWPNPVKSGR